MNNVLIKANAEAVEARREANEAQLKGMQLAIQATKEAQQLPVTLIKNLEYKQERNKMAEAFIWVGACLSCVAVVGYLSYFIWTYGL